LININFNKYLFYQVEMVPEPFFYKLPLIF
jgi:hypothetical protein